MEYGKKRVFITGATGTMGMATLREFATRSDRFALTLLVRPGKRNRKKLKPYMGLPGLRIVWGDLTVYDDVARAAVDADYILHIGGMVSPAADYYPEKTLAVNVAAARNIARGVMSGDKADSAKVVFIGSVAQSGDRRPPYHWGRTGDPLSPSIGDYYALSKIEAERTIVDSGLKHWVCLRQTGILYPALLLKGADPITFHVPLRGLLEWTTDEESGRLMANICEDKMAPEFWNHFYNIGSGESYRITNYEFECMLMKAIGCPPPERSFRTQWFALGNFHGQWWEDSDRLEQLVPFRSGESLDHYMERLASMLPWYFRLAKFAPAAAVRTAMKFVARHKGLGTIGWFRNNNVTRISAHFGTPAHREDIAPWSVQTPQLHEYIESPRGRREAPARHTYTHGYDETKPESLLDIEDMRAKATSLDGRCITEAMKAGDLATPITWECKHGHRFAMSPSLVLLGGHWCPQCQRRHCIDTAVGILGNDPADYASQLRDYALQTICRRLGYTPARITDSTHDDTFTRRHLLVRPSTDISDIRAVISINGHTKEETAQTLPILTLGGVDPLILLDRDDYLQLIEMDHGRHPSDTIEHLAAIAASVGPVKADNPADIIIATILGKTIAATNAHAIPDIQEINRLRKNTISRLEHNLATIR